MERYFVRSQSRHNPKFLQLSRPQGGFSQNTHTLIDYLREGLLSYRIKVAESRSSQNLTLKI
jgi:hypothetical protein